MEIRRGFFAAVIAALILLSGCAIAEIDEMYSLPQANTEYLQLQKLIDAEIAAGSEYSAPTAGSLRQSIQLTDLDGDGENEALAFLRNKDLQPQICVYRKIDGNFVTAATIIGDGTAIGRVEYEDLNGDGVSEILTSWEVNAQMRLLKVYLLKDWAPSVLLTESCIDFLISDLDLDGVSDILALDLEMSGGNVDMFTIDKNGEIAGKSAKLSTSLKTADRFRIGTLSDGVPAVFVEGQYSVEDTSYLLTDVFACSDGELKNITLSEDAEDSATKRHYSVYSTDIDGNGTLDVPIAEKLISSATSSADYYVFDWYSYDSSGNRTKCASTYHDFSDGWFYVLPNEWRDKVSVRREGAVSGERAIVISSVDGETGNLTDLLTIYTLTDENRADRATLDGRFILINSGTVVYAAKINSDGGAVETLAVQDIISRFHLICSEWNSGAIS